ncbi:MAG TPA: UDP-3-O-(3-hydroxymyristoyl)glucosamine N-acyltransferase [Bacteroidales bacterium]|nr:UDP-3-O-(3-hydroxymyristoyl)glucosamine N-acyltransferase [Bacteroidales bacterium]HOK75813.1 UDP-3-O-(3-hydroxymyristoyl)glucosamine N-acyltransferase [Bacteroidales bacterium]HOM40729.1 UDP-3-O-(3-hydroxymyristoyl)glucosamine N-acyltransferase [Bacteroidales bacterium]HPP91276.1 UDP-3-O-(3-hydroxymyristoyl)glucosamine N-acyltransferase [Bacteroidales bacterium]HRR15491.1 UDP-3-O-(3-hydroxymyristoyl)glucosamine N-acyltransferase [Bacteroidales bacterium]
MEFTATVIAQFLKGEIVGNPDVKVSTVARIEEGQEGALSFLANPKYEPYIYTTKSSVVLVNRDFVPAAPVQATLIKVDNAYEAFASLLTMVTQSKPARKGIHPTAVVEPDAKLGENVYVGAFAYIGNGCEVGDGSQIFPHVYIGDKTKVGKECIIYPGVKIYHECVIGNSCIIHAGTVIGSDGFGFAPGADNQYKKIPQIGNVVIEDDVEIGANVAIDRATMGSTVIRKGVKIDNLVQIGHNVEIGENTVMAGQTGIAGSTKIGNNCMIGGQVGIAGHLKIADGMRACAQSGIISDIEEKNLTVMGSPAFEHRHYLKSYLLFKKLTEIKAQLDSVRKEIEELKKE